jgi:two-component system, NtrC family, sensor kinase
MKFFLTILLSAIAFFPGLSQQESYKDADSLLKELSAATTDTSRILLKCKLGEAYRSNNPDTSNLLASEALSKSTEIRYKKGEIRSLILFCVLYREKGDLPEALEAGLKALKIAEQGKYPYEEIFSLVRIANVYFAVRDPTKAMIYLKKSDELLKDHYDDFQWEATQYFLGDGYEQLNQLDAAEKQAQILDAKSGSKPIWQVTINRLRGNIAVKRNELALAIEYYRKSNAVATAGTAYREAATASNAMAQVFKKLNQPDSAIFYAKQGLKLGEMLSYRNRILAASSLLAELYADKDPAEAVNYFRIASAAKDSLHGVQKFQQLQSATMKEQERQTELEAASIAYNNKMRQWALFGGGALFLIIAIILFRNNRQKQKTNKVLENTLHHLRNTQSQLIQSEKMASLGELTAGIAHEIQNPLNFVNNFSEVSRELLDEMKIELDNGNSADAKEIASDVMQNLEKILHHGKRADGIVKGMLQHSRTGSGQKEPTDINSLADEYFRLAYHGLRAKDNSFNVTLKTDYDESIGAIRIIPQDIGRVILNLITNAFYVVNEKKKHEPNGYEPAVSISTKKSGNKILISVKDNGNGIPQNVLDKIFQPFFTTKPTGQGTGLGLSLSYDIITKGHGGELKVKTKEEEGSEFIISIPITNA